MDSELFRNVLRFALLPVAAMMIGAIVAGFRPPGAKLRSMLQHFAAGVVFSVVAVELLPDVIKEHNAAATSVGFALGVAVMLGIKKLTGADENKSADIEAAKAIAESEINEKSGNTKASNVSAANVSTAMLVGIGVDILVDGFLLGIGFAAGAKQGKLLALALTVELLSLGLALASTMSEAAAPHLKIVLTTAGLSALILVGAVTGATVLQNVSAEIFEAVLSFGLAALLFLVTEELLVEAHEVPETPLITSTFFAGFLLFLILGMIS